MQVCSTRESKQSSYQGEEREAVEYDDDDDDVCMNKPQCRNDGTEDSTKDAQCEARQFGICTGEEERCGVMSKGRRTGGEGEGQDDYGHLN